MTILVGISAIFALLLTGSFVMVFRKLASENLPLDDDWVAQVSGDRYRPMQRLLDETEHARLRRDPACTRQMARRFRTGRIRVFRGYLACLSRDYTRISGTVKLVMVQSQQDRPDLASLLVRQRASFTLRLMMAEFRLQLYALGIGRVDVAKLVAALDSMRLELHTLLLATEAAAA
jgi:hypothetical protein